MRGPELPGPLCGSSTQPWTLVQRKPFFRSDRERENTIKGIWFLESETSNLGYLDPLGGIGAWRNWAQSLERELGRFLCDRGFQHSDVVGFLDLSFEALDGLLRLFRCFGGCFHGRRPDS